MIAEDWIDTDAFKPTGSRYVEISASKHILTAFQFAIETRQPVRILGEPGRGKTSALKYYLPGFDGYYVEARGQHKTLPGMLNMLLDTYGTFRQGTQLKSLADAVTNTMNRTYDGYGPVSPLVVDEYQTLEPQTLRELFKITEASRVPLILSGNGETLVNRRDAKAAMAQIDDRIGMRIEIVGLTRQDCIEFCIERNVEGKDAHDAICNYGQRTNVRQLSRLFDQCRIVAGPQGSIHRRHIETALLLITGSEASLKLLSSRASAEE